MQAEQIEDSLYNAVFHFTDPELFGVFMGDIPALELREHLKRSQSLRNRYFAGFRISKDLPSDHQIGMAFRKEIVDRSNGRLASSLCRLWIREHSGLSREALPALGVETKTPADANSWIEGVHQILERDGWEAKVKTAAHILADHFPDEQIQIFMSIIGYGKNQEHLRRVVVEELVRVAADPEVRRQRIREALETAKSQLEKLNTQKLELQEELDGQRQKVEIELDELNKEHNRLTSEAVEIEGSLGKLASDLKRIEAQRSGLQEVYQSSKKNIRAAERGISQRKDQLTSIQAGLAAKLQSAEEAINIQSSRVAELSLGDHVKSGHT